MWGARSGSLNKFRKFGRFKKAKDHNDMENDKQIKIDYYRGAYGPTLRIDTLSKDALMMMRDILHKLASGSVSEYKFHESPFIELCGLQEFYLKLIPKQRAKAVEIAKSEEDKTVVFWSNSLEGWDQRAALLDGMTGTIPSHQYLSQEGIDDALIVVAYLERGEK